MANRRNYYRVLHVQPEAPDEVIKASYRTLMTKLGAHPDRGGDNATAALLNEAYAVLRDPDKRRAYDLSLQQRGTRPGVGQRRAPHPNAATPGASASAGGQNNPSTTANGGCPFCRAPASRPAADAGPCRQCGSPLNAVSGQAKQRGEFFGRRGASRVAKNDLLTLYPSWPHAGVGARLRDVSTTGVSLVSTMAPTLGQAVKLSGPSLEAIARVISVRRSGNLYSIHAQLLTAAFPNRGAFVSARV